MARCERLRRRMALSRQMLNRPFKVPLPKNLEDESLIDYAFRCLDALEAHVTDEAELARLRAQRQSLMDDVARAGRRRG
jgi:hypothetical protein